jgi:hypothetical protein
MKADDRCMHFEQHPKRLVAQVEVFVDPTQLVAPFVMRQDAQAGHLQKPLGESAID